MRPIVCILGSGKLSEELNNQLKTMELPVDYTFIDALQDGKINIPQNIDIFDVFLSSGVIAKRLSEITDKPVVTIKPSIHDTLMAYSKAVKRYKKIVVVTYDTEYSELAYIKNILKHEIVQENYNELEERNSLIQKYKDDGYQCVVGSGEACRIAQEKGMASFFIYPQETLRNYLTIASNMAISIQKEISKNIQLSSVINYAKQGIVLSNNQGSIFLCNLAFASFFEKQSSELIGQNIMSLFGQELNGILGIREIEKDVFVKIRGNSYILDAIPIMYKDRLENLLLFIDDVKAIQKSERSIRKNLITKGFIAKHTFAKQQSFSPCFQRILNTAQKYARSDESIVITGETGTGKEVMAQSIHNFSKRYGEAFVAVNCSAISSNLLESELFGYEEGAFTGARRGGKEGLFEMAHKGTIFLDEISELDLTMQTKLLRAVQEKELMRVGGEKIIPFDARIIAATNQNLLSLVRQKKFREDLYYRLNVLEIRLPPLCERQEDIFLLFHSFIKKLSPALAQALPPLQNELSAILCSYRWPGNVRELENFAKMLVVIAEDAKEQSEILNIIAGSIDEKKAGIRPETPVSEIAGHCVNDSDSSLDEETQAIYDALEKAGGRYNEAAKLLGISRTTLWRKLKNLGFSK